MNKDHYWMCLDAFRSQQDSQKLDSIYIMLYNAEQERKAGAVTASPSSPVTLSDDTLRNTISAHLYPEAIGAFGAWAGLPEQRKRKVDDLMHALLPHLNPDTPCPHVYTSIGGTSHCTLAASDASAENAQIKALVEALRNHAIGLVYSTMKPSIYQCRVCGVAWGVTEKEHHADGCLCVLAAFEGN